MPRNHPLTEHERAQRVGKITMAALEVFREKGYHRARVEDICTRAGIAKGTYYTYFRTREDVAEAAFQQMVLRYGDRALQARGRLEAQIASSDAGSAQSDALALEVILAEIRSLAAEAAHGLSVVPVLFGVLAERIASGNGELRSSVGEAFDALGAAWGDLLAVSGIEDAAALGRTLVSMFDGIVLHAGLFGSPGVDLDAAAETLCALIRSHAREVADAV